jgi:hypothetical protein
VTLSSAKAKELGVKAGDIVVLIGRRRHAAYATVAVAKKGKSGICKVSPNLASNLKVRNEDMVKVVPLGADDDITEKNRSGDLLLLTLEAVPSAESVTFSPIEDSLQALQAAEGGDEIADEDLQARFVQPYVEDTSAVLKQGHVIQLQDENGKKLEFMISHMEVAGEEESKEETGRWNL